MSINSYDEASWDQIIRVVRAADAVWLPSTALEFMGRARELDDALAACPGTSAWHARLAEGQTVVDGTLPEKPQLESCLEKWQREQKERRASWK